MSSKIRNGKAYEHLVFGQLTFNGFDVYPTLADDQGIDGILRVKQPGSDLPKYYDLQIKGGKQWGNIRCKVESLSKNTILLLYSASTFEIIWLTQSDAMKIFPPTGSTFGDVFISAPIREELKRRGFHRLDNLKAKVGVAAG